MPDDELRSTDSGTPEPLREILAAVREIERLLHEMLRLLDNRAGIPHAPATSARVPAARAPRPAAPAADAAERRRELTPREDEIVTLLLTGASNRVIARSLGITERTVKNNLHTVYRKLGVGGRAEAIARFLPALEQGPADAAGASPGNAAAARTARTVDRSAPTDPSPSP
ncbi:helix-turn-helix transcriptional regulator [Streptomyces sp. NPDC085944]|uniref:helix-turn-helix transcriptional regulator n=1 Tax=Streptomyces sp. NPDC085944 TaxID=3154962 RepID=UPI0034183925